MDRLCRDKKAIPNASTDILFSPYTEGAISMLER